MVLVAPEVSRYHALVRETARGAELVHLGRTSTWVDGVEVTDIAALVDGATIEIGGAAVGVALSPGAPEGTTWMLDSAGGARYGITSAPFRVGGSTTDDEVLSDWPPTAASLFPHR